MSVGMRILASAIACLIVAPVASVAYVAEGCSVGHAILLALLTSVAGCVLKEWWEIYRGGAS